MRTIGKTFEVIDKVKSKPAKAKADKTKEAKLQEKEAEKE